MERLAEEPSAPYDCTEGLLPHLRATLLMDWRRPPAHVAALLEGVRASALSTRLDPHVEFAMGVDLAVHDGNEARARCYLAALKRVRTLARAAVTPTWDLACEVQCAVLDQPTIGFRASSARARGGRERYAYFRGVEQIFARKLAADAADGCHPLARAVRI